MLHQELLDNLEVQVVGVPMVQEIMLYQEELETLHQLVHLKEIMVEMVRVHMEEVKVVEEQEELHPPVQVVQLQTVEE